MSYLTDEEKRLLFAALTREKKICKGIDDGKVEDASCKMLVPIVESLERKFYYDRFEQDIYEKAYVEGYDKGFSDGEFIGRNKSIDEFAYELENHSILADIGKLDEMDMRFVSPISRIKEVAKQLKEGK